MRFKLVFSTQTKKGDPVPNGIVVIYDTYKPYRELWFSDNDDQSIRNGIKHFYIQDAIDDGMNQDAYVATMMEQLPKEDLSFKGVKEID